MINFFNFLFLLLVILCFTYVHSDDIFMYFSDSVYREENIQKIIKSVKSPFVIDNKICTLQKQIDSDINHIIQTRVPNSKLQQIALLSVDGGKRIRPIIAYSVIRKMDPMISLQCLKSVNAIEILHSASLIVDDMMDNDVIRRGKPSAHILYGKNITLLAASQMTMCVFMMISEVDMHYMIRYLHGNKKNIKKYKMIITPILQKTIKLIDGQVIDINNEPLSDKNMVLDVLNKKTSSIFEMMFIMCWILGGGNPDSICDIEKMAVNFGIMFQIYDDFTDIVKDGQKGFNLNYVLRFGCDDALNEFVNRRNLFIKQINALGIMTYEIKVIIEYLSEIVIKISKKFRKYDNISVINIK